MKALFLLFVIFYFTAAFSDLNVINPELDDSWLLYKNTYGKTYSKYWEKTRRIIWEENLKKIRDHNLLFDLGLKSYSLGINKFSDLTFDEFKNQFLGLSHSFQNISGETFLPPLNFEKLPDEVDWRKKGYVTPVKDQGRCGSCWAFSATGSFEGQHFRKTGRLISLSEQQLVDCSREYFNNGCNGGLAFRAFNYLKVYGIQSEESYPYKAKDGTCQYNSKNVVARCTGFSRIPAGNEDSLKAAVASVGPVSVSIAVLESFMHYRSGVYDEPSCSSTKLNHAVLSVGYGSSTGLNYWLVKNSWSTSWGMSGYVMMSRNKQNQCGIATRATFPTV